MALFSDVHKLTALYILPTFGTLSEKSIKGNTFKKGNTYTAANNIQEQ